MSHFRFSLRALAVLVAAIGMSCAALAYASSWLSGIVWSVTFLLLAFATVAAVLRSPPQRSWWLGFATFGWLYVLAMSGPLSGPSDWMQVHKILGKAATKMPKATSTIAVDSAGFNYGITSGEGALPAGMPGMGGMDGGAMSGGMGMGGMGAGSMGPGGTGSPGSTFQIQNNEYITAFTRTSQALLALLLACLGGFSGRLIHHWNRTEKMLQ
jgi:hypothetical protein